MCKQIIYLLFSIASFIGLFNFNLFTCILLNCMSFLAVLQHILVLSFLKSQKWDKTMHRFITADVRIVFLHWFFFFQLLNPESCWRAVWTNDAGVHDGGYSAPWHEDIRNCHCKQFSTRLSVSVRNVIIVIIIF